jgi:hypothetical protein
MKMIPNNKTWMSLLAGSCAFTAMLSAVPFNSLVEEDVDVFFSVRSLAESRAEWEGHPLAEVIENPKLQEFFQPLFDASAEVAEEEESMTEVMENEFGLTVDDFFELFPGEIALAWYNLPELALEQAERPDLVILAAYAGDPERLAELMQVQFERNAESQREMNPAMEHAMVEESFMGETLYFDEAFDGEETYIEDGYALVNGVFILASPEDRLRSAVEAIKDGSDAPLGENTAYLRSREKGGRGDLSLYVNLEAILPPLNAVLLSKSMASGAAMFGLSADSLDAVLSLESMQAFFLDLDLIEEGLSSHSGMVYREKAGLLRLMSYVHESLPAARYVPKGVLSTSVTTVDLGAMLVELEALLTVASPSMPIMIDMQMQNIRTNTGVDLRASLLENLGGDMVSLSSLPAQVRGATVPLQPDQLFVVALKDAEALSSALEALKDLVPGIREQLETQEFAGQTIHSIKTVPGTAEAPASMVSYVITRSNFILSIGRIGLLQEVLTGMEVGDDGFWQQAETEALFEQIAMPDAVSRSYVDVGKILVPIFQSMVQASQMGGEATALDMQSIPTDLSLPFYLISEVTEAEDGLFTRALMLQREDSE